MKERILKKKIEPVLLNSLVPNILSNCSVIRYKYFQEHIFSIIHHARPWSQIEYLNYYNLQTLLIFSVISQDQQFNFSRKWHLTSEIKSRSKVKLRIFYCYLQYTILHKEGGGQSAPPLGVGGLCYMLNLLRLCTSFFEMSIGLIMRDVQKMVIFPKNH